MPLSPQQILSATSTLFGDGGGGISSLRSRDRQSAEEAALEALKAPAAEKDSPGIFDRVKGALGTAIRPVAETLDYGRAAVVAGANELGDAISEVVGTAGEGEEASFSDFRHNLNRRVGVGDLLEENTLTTDLPMPVKQALGGIGDLVLDPLNYATLGTSGAAKAGLTRVAAAGGDDLSRVLAREGVEAADKRLAADFAAKQAAEAEARYAGVSSTDDLFDRLAATRAERAVGGLDGAGTATAPTIRSILGEGVSEAGLDKMLTAIERTGRGGIGLNLGRRGAPTLVPGSAFDPLRAPLKDSASWLRGTEAGQGLRKALVPLTQSRDAFGQHVAAALPGIAHRRKQLVDAAKIDLDASLKAPLEAAIGTPELEQITAALDVGGSASAAFDDLADLPDAQALLSTLVQARDTTYDALIRAGKNPDDLMAKDEYLRHVLTDDGRKALGIEDVERKGARNANFQERVREGSILEQNAADDAVSYVDDPVKLVRSSYHYAQDVLGNAGAVDALEDYARKIKLPDGVNVEDIVSRKAKPGFVQVAPNGWVADSIYQDLFNLGKSGTQSKLVRSWDTFSSIIKRQTLFNPIAFGPYFTQNMATGVAMNTIDGVRVGDYALTARLHRAVATALKEGGEESFEANLRRLVPDAAEREVAMGLRSEGIFEAGHSIYDDVASDGPLNLDSRSTARKVSELGTQHTVKVNAYGEQMLRGSAYVRHRLNGLSSDAAADLVRKRHLDYSGIGRTAFERNAINRFVFFPTWLMRAPSAIVKAYAHTPGLANVQAKLEMGENWSARERNEYGEIIGPRMSGPLSFLTDVTAGGDVTGSIDKPTDLLNPVAKYVLDEDSRRVTDLLPPLGNILTDKGEGLKLFPNAEGSGGRLGGVINDDGKRSRYLRSLLGIRTGVDYAKETGAELFEKELAERQIENERRVAAGEEPLDDTTPTIRLKNALLELGGGGEVYSMTRGDMSRALLGMGLTAEEIGEIILGTAPAPKAAAQQPAEPQIYGIRRGDQLGDPPVWEDGSTGYPRRPRPGREGGKSPVLGLEKIERSPLLGKV